MSKPIAVFFLLALLAGCSHSPVDSTTYKPDYARGKAIYESQCRSCHDTGKRGAPSIKDIEDWDTTTLTRPGITQQHLVMKLLQGPNASLSEHDDADVRYYLFEEIGDREENY